MNMTEALKDELNKILREIQENKNNKGIFLRKPRNGGGDQNR